MSKIAKGVKKVFKGVKKVVKKIAKPVLIGAAIFFTAGVAAGGFAAFSGVSSLSGFFGAVGNTIGVGFQATMGSLGLSSGVSGSLAATTGVAPGTTLGTGTFAQALGLSTGPTAGAAAMEAGAAALGPGPFSQQALIEAGTKGGGILGMGQPLAAAPTATSGGLSWLTGETVKQASQNTGLFGKLGGAVKGMASSNVGQIMLAQGLMNGFQAYAQSEQAEKERKRFMKSGVFGVARGEQYGQAADPESIRQMAAQIPGTSAYADQQAQQTAQTATGTGTQPVQTPVPSGQSASLIGQTYEEGERRNPYQLAMNPNFGNPYNPNNQQNMPLLG